MSVDLKNATKHTDLARLMLEGGEKLPEQQRDKKPSKWAEASVGDILDDLRASIMRVSYHDNNLILGGGTRFNLEVAARAVPGVQAVEIDELTEGHVNVRLTRLAPEVDYQLGHSIDQTEILDTVRTALDVVRPAGLILTIAIDTPNWHFSRAAGQALNHYRGWRIDAGMISAIQAEIAGAIGRRYGLDAGRSVRVEPLMPRYDRGNVRVFATIDNVQYAAQL